MGKREKLESVMALKEIKKRAVFLIERNALPPLVGSQECQVNSAPLS